MKRDQDRQDRNGWKSCFVKDRFLLQYLNSPTYTVHEIRPLVSQILEIKSVETRLRRRSSFAHCGSTKDQVLRRLVS